MKHITSGHTEHEHHVDAWPDEGVDSTGPNIVKDLATSIELTPEYMIITFDCAIGDHQHQAKVGWEYGPRFVFTYNHCPTLDKTRQQSVIQVRAPQGFANDFWHNGHATPGTIWPDHAGPATRLDVTDAYQHDNPTANTNCPTGCVRDHTSNPADVYHHGPVWSNPGRPEDGMQSSFFFRTQQHQNADPRAPFNWLQLEIFDLEHAEHYPVALTMTEAQQLVDILQDHLTGKARLAPTVDGQEN